MVSKSSCILIVDDNIDNIQVLGTALQEQHYHLVVAQNGEQALKALKEFMPALILLDVMMPGLDGFQICKIIKNNPRTQHIEVIFITAATTNGDELKGLSLGAVDYIHKPFSIPIVQAKVALHLERIEHRKLREDVERVMRHDLKTPLNALLGFPQLMLEDDNLTAEQRGYLQYMQDVGKEMLHMINNSLDLFKMEIGTYQYKPQPVDICLLINGITKDLISFIRENKVEVVVSKTNNLISLTENFFVLAEKYLSYSLFANLIRNAIEASTANSIITINLDREDNEGVITITNSGSVPEEIQHIFFDKYVTFGKKQGTGLGTYSAKLMAEVQNGSIAMTSTNNETCITVRLPLYTEASHLKNNPQSSF